MALIKCPECGKEKVSDTAMSCPECGFNIHNYVVKQRQLNNIQAVKNTETVKKERNKSNKKIYTLIILLGALAVFVISFAIGYYRLSKKGGNTDVNDKINIEDNTGKKENTSQPKKYTKKELTESIKNYIDENYSEQLSYDIDEYDDTMLILFNDAPMGKILSLENSCYLLCTPYMKVVSSGDEGKLTVSIDVLYGSANFLDYYFGSAPFVVLAEDGTRETFSLYNYDTYDDNGHYYTDFYLALNYDDSSNMLDDTKLENAKALFSKSGLTCKLNKENNNNYSITGELDSDFCDSIVSMIDIYTKLKEDLNFSN